MPLYINMNVYESHTHLIQRMRVCTITRILIFFLFFCII